MEKPPALTGAMIEFGLVQLDRITPREDWLPPSEISRCRRYATESLQNRALATRTALRRILAHYLGHDRPRDLIFAQNEFGKPFLANSAQRIHFNISHSHDVLLLAVSREYEVGVDIEQVRPSQDWIDLARHQWGDPVAARLLKLPPTQQVETFFSIWTRHEAVQKALGVGLVDGATLVDDQATEDWRPVAQNGTDLNRPPTQVRSLVAPQGYAAAMATVSSILSPTCASVDLARLAEE